MKLNKKLALAVASAVLSISSSAFAAVDFLNDDAPFKTDINIAGHNGDLQLYGIIDIGAAHVNHSLPSNSALPNNIYPYSFDANGGYAINAGSQTTWMNGGMQDSRLGLRGGLDLFSAADNKFKFIYALEIGYNPLVGELNNALKTLSENSTGNCVAKKTCSVFADSSLNGELFGRQAWGGVDGGNLGKLTFGIQYNPFYDIAGAYDPNHKSDTFSPLGESGAIGGGGGISENARMKNSIKYANSFVGPMDGKINGSAMYQFGNNIDTNWGRGYAVQGGYENSLFGFQAAYNNFTDTVKLDLAETAYNGSLSSSHGITWAPNNGAAAATANTNGASIRAGLYDTQAWIFAAKLTPSKEIKGSLGYEWMELSTPTDNNIAYGNIDGYNILGGIATTLSNSSKGISAGNGGDHQDIRFWWAGGEYNFGERFPVLSGLTLSGAYYYTTYGALQGTDPRGTNYAGVTGKNWNESTQTLILDYVINKRFDVYGAATWNQFDGTYVNTVNSGGTPIFNKNVDAYGFGVRMKF
jgi:hypothetical protein